MRREFLLWKTTRFLWSKTRPFTKPEQSRRTQTHFNQKIDSCSKKQTDKNQTKFGNGRSVDKTQNYIICIPPILKKTQ